MKKILGIHPALIILLAIFLGLNIFDWLSPKPSKQEQNDRVIAHKPQTDKKNEIVFHDLSQPVDNDIEIFTHPKWYKSKSSLVPANSASIQPSQNKQIVNATLPVSKSLETQTTNVEAIKKVTTKDEGQGKKNIKVAMNPTFTKSASEAIVKPPTQATIEKSMASEIDKKMTVLSDIKVNYLGKYMENDRSYVFLEVNGENRAVALGSMVDSETKVSAIEKDSVRLTNVRTGISKILNTQ